MNITPINNSEKYAFFEFERKIQKKLDEYYLSRGHTPNRSQADEYHDVVLDNEKIEEKIRIGTWNDILVEISQDIVTGAIGWFGKTKCDYLHYVFCQDEYPIMLYRINWVMFKNWFISVYLKEHKSGRYVYSDRGWGATINIPILLSIIPGEVMCSYKIEYTEQP